MYSQSRRRIFDGTLQLPARQAALAAQGRRTHQCPCRPPSAAARPHSLCAFLLPGVPLLLHRPFVLALRFLSLSCLSLPLYARFFSFSVRLPTGATASCGFDERHELALPCVSGSTHLQHAPIHPRALIHLTFSLSLSLSHARLLLPPRRTDRSSPNIALGRVYQVRSMGIHGIDGLAGGQDGDGDARSSWDGSAVTATRAIEGCEVDADEQTASQTRGPRHRRRRPSTRLKTTTAFCALLASSFHTAMAQNNCISLADSTACSAFSSASISTNSNLTGLFPFLSDVTDVSSFDSGIQSYIDGGYSQLRWVQLCINGNSIF